MTTRTGYLIKHTLTSARDNSVVALSQGDVREDRRVGYAIRCYLVNLPSILFYCCKTEAARSKNTCYFPATLIFCCKMEFMRSVVFDWISYPPLILISAVQSTYITPLHRYHCICSIDPCLRVLWMSTHGCFSPPFPLLSLLLG